MQAFEGEGKAITVVGSEVLITPTLRYEFTNENVGKPDETIKTVHTTTVTYEEGSVPRGAISKQRSCVETQTVDPKYTCYDFELYDTTFFLRVTRETITEPGQASALGGSVTEPHLAAAAYADEMGPDVICYIQYGLTKDEGTVTVTEQAVVGCGDVKVSLADGDLSFTESSWSARVNYTMKGIGEMEAQQDSDLKTIDLMTDDMADLYAYTSYYDPNYGTFRVSKGPVTLDAEEPVTPEP